MDKEEDKQGQNSDLNAVLKSLTEKLGVLEAVAEKVNNLETIINQKKEVSIEEQIKEKIASQTKSKADIQKLADAKFWLDHNLKDLLKYFENEFSSENIMFLNSFVDITTADSSDYLTKKNKITEQILKKLVEENHKCLNENTRERITQGKYEDALSDVMLAVKTSVANQANQKVVDDQSDLYNYYDAIIRGLK